MKSSQHLSSNDYTRRKIRLKCRYDGEIRTVTITPETDITVLKKRLASDYGFEVSLKYTDTEGDYITLSSQNDLDDLFLHCDTDIVNAVVSEAISLPTLQLKNTGKQNSLNSTSGLSSSLQSARDQWPPALQTQRMGMTSRVERFPSIDVGGHNTRSVADTHNQVKWKRAEILGQGAFGVVYLGLNIESGELMAVKQMATDEVSKRELASLENEINLLRGLRHPNIVRYIGTELNAVSMSIFLEYVPGGSLKTLIDKFGALDESVAKSYTRQLLLGLEYLHRNGIAHRDIKGANCLVGNDGVIKLADFGNSKHWRNSNQSATVMVDATMQQSDGGKGGAMYGAQPSHASSGHDIKGTPSWMAPEVIRDQGAPISWRKADIWSLGCTALEMTSGKPPWSQFNNPVTILFHIACQDTLPDFPDSASLELITFLNVCLQRDPSSRPDVTSLLLHPFVSTMGVNGGNAWAGGTGMFNNRPTTVSSLLISEWDSLSTARQPEPLTTTAAKKWRRADQSNAHPTTAQAAASPMFFPDSDAGERSYDANVNLSLDLPTNNMNSIHSEQSTPRISTHTSGVVNQPHIPHGVRSARGVTNSNLLNEDSAFIPRAVQSARQSDSAQSTPRSTRLSTLAHQQQNNLVNSPISLPANDGQQFLLHRQISRESNSSMVSFDLPQRQQSIDSITGYGDTHMVPIRSFSALTIDNNSAAESRNDGSSSGLFIEEQDAATGGSLNNHDVSMAAAKNPEETHELANPELAIVRAPYVFEQPPQQLRRRTVSDGVSIAELGAAEDSMSESLDYGSAVVEINDRNENFGGQVAAASMFARSHQRRGIPSTAAADESQSGSRTTVIPPLSYHSTRNLGHKTVTSGRRRSGRNDSLDLNNTEAANKFIGKQSSNIGSDGDNTDTSGNALIRKKTVSGKSSSGKADRTTSGRERGDRRNGRTQSATKKVEHELKQHETLHKKRMERRKLRGDKDDIDSDGGSVSSLVRKEPIKRRNRDAKGSARTGFKNVSDMEVSADSSPTRVSRKEAGIPLSKNRSLGKEKLSLPADGVDESVWSETQISASPDVRSSAKRITSSTGVSSGSSAAPTPVSRSCTSKGTTNETASKVRKDCADSGRRVLGIASAARPKVNDRQHRVHWHKDAEEVYESEGNASFDFHSLQSSSFEHMLDGDNFSLPIGEDEAEESKDSFTAQSTVVHDLEQSVQSMESIAEEKHKKQSERNVSEAVIVPTEEDIPEVGDHRDLSALVDAHLDEDEVDEELDIPNDDELFPDDDDEIEEQSLMLSALRTVPSANTTAAMFRKNNFDETIRTNQQRSVNALDDNPAGQMIIQGASASRSNLKSAVSSNVKAPARSMTSRQPSSSMILVEGDDNKGEFKNTGNRRSLENLKFSAHRNSSKAIRDPLEMSTDSLDPLQVTGMASAVGGSRPIISSNGDSGAVNNGPKSAGRLRRGIGSVGTKPDSEGVSSGAVMITATPKTSGPRARNGNTVGIVTMDNDCEASMEDDTNSSIVRYRRLSEMRPLVLMEHTATVTRLRAPLKTSLLLSASVDGTVRMWERGDTYCRCTLDASGFEAVDGSVSTSVKADRQVESKPERRLSSHGTHIRNMISSDHIVDDAPAVGAVRTATAGGRNVKFVQLWAEDNCASIWAAGSDMAIRIWSGAEARPQRILRGHDESITAMEGIDPSSLNSTAGSMLQASSCLVATGSADRSVRIWDGRAKKAQVFIFRGHTDSVLTLRWGEGGRSIISAGKDKTIRIWDTRAGRLRVTMEKHFGSISAVRVLPEVNIQQQANSKGQQQQLPFLISGGKDSMLNYWTASGDCISSQAAHRGAVGFISEVNFDVPNLRAVSANPSSDVTGTKPNLNYGNGNPLMISLGNDSVIKVWDARRLKCITEISSRDQSLTSSQQQQRPSRSRGASASHGTFTKAIWCPRSSNIGGDGGLAFVTGSSAGVVRLYEFNSTANATKAASNVNPSGSAHYPHDSSSWVGTDLACHSDGSSCSDLIISEQLMASSSRGGQILRWEW